MKKKRFSVEQITAVLQQADQGVPVADLCRKVGISEQSFYRWKKVYGKPIVCTPADAYRCFMRTGIDSLAIEDCLLDKSDQPPIEDDGSWQKEFQLD